MAERIVSFVLSGGVGSRLWPLSREDNPKQFHDLSGNGSMLVKTVRRMRARPRGETPVWVIAAERHADRIRVDLGGVDLSGGGLIFEPEGRNTAAAVAVATLKTIGAYGDGLVLVAPSDHEISTEQEFWRTIEKGAPAARSGRLVVFGVTPTRPETGYGYIEANGLDILGARDVVRFVEKPDLAKAKAYLDAGGFFWNTGLFLFRASAMREAFLTFQPEVWEKAEASLLASAADATGAYLPPHLYGSIPSISIDYAVVERVAGIAMVPAQFSWSDLGSWRSLLDLPGADENGNVVTGDVIAIDCERSYLHSQGRLLSAVGLKDVAVVATADATFVAPVGESQNVRKVVEQLERKGRLETRFTPSHDRVPVTGAWRSRVEQWLFHEALPLWSAIGVDERHGGFHEALGFDGAPLALPKRIRTMARQVYAFAVAKARGWDGPADRLIAHGVAFMAQNGRTRCGGWVRSLNADGAVADATEDAYDHACVLLALAHAHGAGHEGALRLGEETLAFLDDHLEDERLVGFRENAQGEGLRRSNPHMHLLEAFLAWHSVTGERTYLRRAARIVGLFRSHFFDAESWTLGEYFDDAWRPAAGDKGHWTEPGHHFEWASLLVDFAERTGQADLYAFARKLYASAVANGLNRATGLAYGAVTRDGMPLDRVSRSWPQAEAIKAAIALDGTGGPDMKPEIEARMGRLFRWHIEPAPAGMWIDRIDEKGRPCANEVPASILYHLTMALTRYMDKTEGAAGDPMRP